MKLKDYAVIDINWINDRINTIELMLETVELTNEKYNQHLGERDMLIKIKQQLQPLLPICEKCFDEGKNQKKRAINTHPANFSLKKDKEDFLNSEIQLP